MRSLANVTGGCIWNGVIQQYEFGADGIICLKFFAINIVGVSTFSTSSINTLPIPKHHKISRKKSLLMPKGI